MKKILVTLLICCFFSSIINAQKWERSYEKGNGFWGMNGIETYDRGFVFCGIADRLDYDGLLIKTDLNGKVLWKKYMTMPSYISIVKQTRDSGLLIGGLHHLTPLDCGAYIMKLNPCGEVQWCTIFTYPDSFGSNYIDELKELPNGDILLQAEGFQYPPYYNEAIFFCISKEGSFKWKFANGGTVTDILLLNSSTIVLSGYIYTHDPHTSGSLLEHSFATLLDTSGLHLTTDIYGRYTIDSFHFGIGLKAFRTPDGGFLAVNRNDNDSSFAKEGNQYIIKYNDKGQRQWIKFISKDAKRYEGAIDGANINDSTYILIGHTFQSTDFVPRLNIITASGQVLKTKDFPRSEITQLQTIDRTSDAKFFICGGAKDATSSNYIYCMKLNEKLDFDTFYTHSNFKYDYLCKDTIPKVSTIAFPSVINEIKVDTMHFYSAITNQPAPAPFSVSIYPNPSSGTFYFRLKEAIHKEYKLRVINSIGVEVLQQPITSNITETIFSLEGQPAGIYLILIESRSGTLVSRRIAKK